MVPAALGQIPPHSAVWVPRPMKTGKNVKYLLKPYIVRTWTLSLSRWSKRFIVDKQQHSTEQNIFEPASPKYWLKYQHWTESASVSTIPDRLSCIKRFWSLPLTCEYCLHCTHASAIGRAVFWSIHCPAVASLAAGIAQVPTGGNSLQLYFGEFIAMDRSGHVPL